MDQNASFLEKTLFQKGDKMNFDRVAFHENLFIFFQLFMFRWSLTNV